MVVGLSVPPLLVVDLLVGDLILPLFLPVGRRIVPKLELFAVVNILSSTSRADLVLSLVIRVQLYSDLITTGKDKQM